MLDEIKVYLPPLYFLTKQVSLCHNGNCLESQIYKIS